MTGHPVVGVYGTAPLTISKIIWEGDRKIHAAFLNKLSVQWLWNVFASATKIYIKTKHCIALQNDEKNKKGWVKLWPGLPRQGMLRTFKDGVHSYIIKMGKP